MSSSSPPSPPFLSRFWPTFRLVLAALGIPVTGAAIFLTQHPLLALGMGLLYEVAIFLLAFLGRVWGNLEDPWAKSIANWVGHWVQDIVSRYRKKYYCYLRYQHRDLDVKGLSILGTYGLELDQVFVQLSIDPTTPQQATANPIRVPQTLYNGSHAIWDYLASAPLSNQPLVIIGPPGSGKTTLLKHITLTLAAHGKLYYRFHYVHTQFRKLVDFLRGAHRKLPYRSPYVRIPHKLPILLFLRDHVAAINEQPDFSLVDALRDHLKKWEQPLPLVDWVKRQLSRGRCLVMLDGLDEVSDTEIRKVVVDWVQRQMVAYHQNRFIVTSRPFGYRSNPLSGVTVLEVRSFTTEQVERFIYNWYLANEIMSKQKNDPGVRMRAKADARALLQRLHNTPTLLELTVNPLLLTMIATVHRYGGELPGNRMALYAEICEVFLGKRQLARGQKLELTPAQMQLVLELLACYMMVEGIRDIKLEQVRKVIEEPLRRVSSQMLPETFLQLVENVSGLLLERENGVYSFAHLTFQEYLAATYIREKNLGKILVARVGATWWQETIRLYCSMADATPILAVCLASNYPSTPTLELAIDCDKEAREVRPEVRIRLETLLKEGVEDSNLERQHVIAGALLARRLRRMFHLKEEIYVDISLITCVEYQVFLDERQARGYYLQPDHWTSYRFPPGQGNAPILGVRPSDAAEFCTWLTERESGPWLYRLPEVGELEQKGDDLMLGRLPAGTGYWLKDGKGLVWAREAIMLPDTIVEELRHYILTLPYNHDLARIVPRGRNCAIALDIDRDLALTRAHKLVRDLDQIRDLALIIAHVLNLDLELDNNRTIDLALALKNTLDLVLDRKSDRGLAGERNRILALASDFIYHQKKLSPRRGRLQFPRLGRPKNREEGEIQYLIESLLDICIDLIVLEKRNRGEVLACEGILIVKERKESSENKDIRYE